MSYVHSENLGTEQLSPSVCSVQQTHSRVAHQFLKLSSVTGIIPSSCCIQSTGEAADEPLHYTGLLIQQS